jgi:PadR family transcriptional regulator, regulatory protein PadR
MGAALDLQIVRPIIVDVNGDPPRLSTTERTILELLTSGPELFGLQLVKQSRGTLKRGTVYVTLGRMQDKGFVESRTEPLPPGGIGLPRRLYRPTAYGLRVLDSWNVAAHAFARYTPREA